MQRRDFAKTMAGAMVGLMLPGGRARAAVLEEGLGLSDPADQVLFANPVPDALSPGFIYQPDRMGRYKIKLGPGIHDAGLLDPNGNPVTTPIWGYGDWMDQTFTWPGRTFQILSSKAGGAAQTEVFWQNALDAVDQHLLPVDTSLHWCFSLPGYTRYTIRKRGVPIITHLHGGHTDFQYDGNPEYFYTPSNKVVGPQWDNVPGGFTNKFVYDNNVPAGNLWYHDHALGITRLNVYAGLAGFYFVRDDLDTGTSANPLGLPAWPYEKAYAIQDRIFLNTGELFYPAYPGDPFYEGFIDEEGANLPAYVFPDGGPSALAEFFGDHMVVNGVIWPFERVEPRNYRMHLLNGCDSRFMAIQFFEVPPGATDFTSIINGPLDFTVVGSDQGLAAAPNTVDTLLFEPGSRYDIIFDFKTVASGNRVIMRNIAGDSPFGGDLGDAEYFDDRQTDRIMAFDVDLDFGALDPGRHEVTLDPGWGSYGFGPNVGTPTRTRKVALFEGRDEYNRLQPLLGTAEPATDYNGDPIDWPDDPRYASVGLVGQMEGSIAWHSPTTENPALDTTEEWEIWNVTADAHPIHLHLVHFEVLGRQEIKFDSNVDEDGFIPEGSSPAGDGAYVVTQPVVQHNGAVGSGRRIVHPESPATDYGPDVTLDEGDGYVENTPRDMVIALPGQITRIKARFDKPGRYVWHCHILSHEDHEMMRVLHVGPGA